MKLLRGVYSCVLLLMYYMCLCAVITVNFTIVVNL